MKKLFTTIIGVIFVMALTAESIAQKRVATMRFAGWAAENPDFRFSHQLKAAYDGIDTENNWNSSLASVYIDNVPQQYPAAATNEWTAPESSSSFRKPFAQGLLNSGNLNVEFDYSGCAPGSDAASFSDGYNKKRLWYYTSRLIPSQGAMNLYPGVQFKISLPGKRIKRVIIHTGMPETPNGIEYSFNNVKLTSNLALIGNFGALPNAFSQQMAMNLVSGDNGTMDVVITANELWGTGGEICLKVNGFNGMVSPKDNSKMVYPLAISKAASSEITTSTSVSTVPSGSCRQNEVAFRMTSIDVEYFDEIEQTIPLNQSVKEHGLSYFNSSSGKWAAAPTGDSYSINKSESGTDKVRIGDYIIEIDASDAVGSAAYAVRGDASYGVGIMLGSRFRIYPDPEKYKAMDGGSAKAITVNGIVSGTGLVYSGSQCSLAYICYINAQRSGLYLSPSFDGLVSSGPLSLNMNCIFTAQSEMGMAEDTDSWLSTTPKDGLELLNTTVRSGAVTVSQNVLIGKAPLFWIDAIEGMVSSSSILPSVSGTVQVDTKQRGRQSEDGVWQYVGDFNMKVVVPKDNNYGGHTVRYIFADRVLQPSEFDVNKSTLAQDDFSITFNGDKGVINARVYGLRNGEEIPAAEIIPIAIEPLAVTHISSYDDLLNPANQGKIIVLDFLTKMFNERRLNKLTVNYLVDAAGNVVKASRKLEKSSSVGCLSSTGYVPVGGVIGVLRLDEQGLPVVEIGNTVDDTFDYSSFCAKSTDNSVTNVAPSDYVYKTEQSKVLNINDIRKIVTLRQLAIKDKDKNILTDIEGNEIYIVNESNYLPSDGFQSDKKYTVNGVLDYEDGRYAVRLIQKVYEAVDRPQVAILNADLLPDTPEGVDKVFKTSFLSGIVSIEYTPIKSPNENNSIYYYIDDVYGNKSLAYPFRQLSQVDVKEHAISSLTFKNGKARISFRAANQMNANASVYEYSDPLIIELHDNVSMGFKTGSVSDFIQAFSGIDAGEITENTYVTFTKPAPDSPSPLAVVMIKNKYILAADPNNDNPDYLLVKIDDNDDWFATTSDTYLYKYHVYVRPINNWLNSYYRVIGVGDAINTLVGRPFLQKGNWLINPSSAASLFSSSAKQGGDPIYGDDVDRLLKGVEVSSAEGFGSDDLENMVNKMVAIKKMAISRDDHDYYMNAGKPAPLHLKLKWDILAPEKKSFHQGIVDNVDQDYLFDVTGLVRRDGNGGYELEVVDLTLDFALKANLCGHEGHATYSGDFTDLESLDDGVPVLLTGVQLLAPTGNDIMTTKIGNVPTYTLSFLAVNEAEQRKLITDAINDEFVLAAIKIGTDLRVIMVERIPPLDVKLEPIASESGMTNFIDYTNLSFRNASGRTIYYKVLPATDPTKAPDKDAWSQTEEKVYTSATAPNFNDSQWIQAYTCDPGMSPIRAAENVLIRKTSISVSSIEELVSIKTIPGNMSSFQLTGEALVAEVNHENDYAVLTDGKGNHIMVSYIRDAEEHIAENIVVGSYVSDFVLTPVNNGVSHAYRINTDAVGKFRVKANPETEIYPTEAVRRELEVTSEHYGQYIRLMNAKVEEDANNVKTVTLPYSNTELRLCHFGPSFDYSGDGLYHITGYVLPQTEVGLRKSSDVSQVATFAESRAAQQKFDFFVTGALFKETSQPPIFYVENAESVEDGKAITINQVTVSIACEAEDAYLEVAVDDQPWNKYYGPFVVPCSAVIHARATEPDKVPCEADLEVVMEYLSGDLKLTPVPAAGYTLVMATPIDEKNLDPDEYEIRYTLDGSEPGRTSELYNGSVKIEMPTTFKAVLIENGKRPGSVASIKVAVQSGDVAVINEPHPGYSTVTISPSSKDESGNYYTGNIYYTLDGSEPTTASTRYTVPLTIETDGTTVKAFMEDDEKAPGKVTTVVVGVRSSDVVISCQESPSYTMVTLAPSTNYTGTIRYTLDGSDPTSSSAEYSAPINVTRNATVVKARMYEAGKAVGDVATVTVNVRSSDVVITTNTDEGITYVTLTVSGNATGAIIRFTLDGSDPTEESAIYTETIDLFETAVLKAAVFEEGKGRGEILEQKVEVTGILPLPMSGDLTYTLEIKADEQAAYVTLAPVIEPDDTYYIYFSRNGSAPSVATERYHSEENEVVKVTRSCVFKAVMIERGKRPGKVLEFEITIPQSGSENPPVVGIDGVEADSAADIKVEGNIINAPEGSEIYDLNGRRMRSGIELRPGIYIVRLRSGLAVKVRVG